MTNSYKKYKRYYDRKKQLGWKTYTVFGSPELIRAIKSYVKQWKRDQDAYTYKKYSDNND